MTKPNEVTIRAIEEAEELLTDPNTQTFETVDELFEDLESEQYE